jgi:hypothetical protein
MGRKKQLWGDEEDPDKQVRQVGEETTPSVGAGKTEWWSCLRPTVEASLPHCIGVVTNLCVTCALHVGQCSAGKLAAFYCGVEKVSMASWRNCFTDTLQFLSVQKGTEKSFQRMICAGQSVSVQRRCFLQR